LNNIGEIEKIRILKSERIQDGVNRIIFAAGDMVDEYQKEEEKLYRKIITLLESHYQIQQHDAISQQLESISEQFSVPIEQLPKTLHRFVKEAKPKLPKQFEINSLSEAGKHLFNVWKKSRKQKKTISEDDLNCLLNKAETIKGTEFKVLTAKTDTESNATAGALIEHESIVVHIYDGNKITSAASENIAIDLRTEIAPAIGKIIGGSGGGREKMTQSGGPKKENVDEALKKAKELTIKTLQKK
jgi:alanyl-tRNA synthetase